MEREQPLKTTTTVYDSHDHGRNGVQEELVMTVGNPKSGVKARGCLNTSAMFEVLLGVVIIAVEATCVAFYYGYEESSVGVWVGIFAVITGIVGLIAAGQTHRCIFTIEWIVAVICVIKAFSMFAASATLLAVAVNYNYQLQNSNYTGVIELENGGVYSRVVGLGPGRGYYGGVGLLGIGYGGGYYDGIGLGYGGGYYGSGYYGHSFYGGSQALLNIIGMKAALMVLYFILFIVSAVSSVLSCVNCCRKSSKQQVVNVYPNGH